MNLKLGWILEISDISLAMKAIDLLFQTSDISEMMVFDSLVPREFQLTRWLPRIQQDFRNSIRKRCVVVEQINEDEI